MDNAVQFYRSNEALDYETTAARLKELAAEVHATDSYGLVLLVEHPHVYTMGTSANTADVIDLGEVPLVQSNRGGKITYHGPGQRIIYPILNLKKLYKDPDIRRFITDLGNWMCSSLDDLGVHSSVEFDNVGIWTEDGGNKSKIGAIGIRLHKWVSYHGIAININTDLSYFNRIIPCGIKEFGVCSTSSLGKSVNMQDFDESALKNFSKIFSVSTCGITNSFP